MQTKYEEIKERWIKDLESGKGNPWRTDIMLLLKALELASNRIWEMAKKEEYVFGRDIEPAYWVEKASKDAN